MDEKVRKWRNKRWNRKCDFCKYFDSTYVTLGGYSVYSCKAKDKQVFHIKRPFCQTFELKE